MIYSHDNWYKKQGLKGIWRYVGDDTPDNTICDREKIAAENMSALLVANKEPKIKRNMMKIMFPLILSGICFGADELQFWTGTKLSTKLNETTKFTFTEEFRFGDDAGSLYRHHSDIGFNFISIFDNIDLGLNFMKVFQEDSSDGWLQEDRPHINVTYRGTLFGLSFSDRSRLEYRSQEDKDDLWRYRNRFTINRPFEYLDSEELDKLRETFKPYVADEIFINCDGSGYARNRVYAGVIVKLMKNIAGDAYYLWQLDEIDTGTKDIQVLGFNLVISF